MTQSKRQKKKPVSKTKKKEETKETNQEDPPGLKPEDNTKPPPPKKSGITRIDAISNSEMVFGNVDMERDEKYMIPKNTLHKYHVKQWKTWPEGSDNPGAIVQGSEKPMSYDQAYWLRYMHIPENPKKGVKWKPGFLKQIGLSFTVLNDPSIIRLRTADGDFKLLDMNAKQCVGTDGDGRANIPMNDILEFINLT